jgi:hypothetical protein
LDQTGQDDEDKYRQNISIILLRMLEYGAERPKNA